MGTLYLISNRRRSIAKFADTNWDCLNTFCDIDDPGSGCGRVVLGVLISPWVLQISSALLGCHYYASAWLSNIYNFRLFC